MDPHEHPNSGAETDHETNHFLKHVPLRDEGVQTLTFLTKVRFRVRVRVRVKVRVRIRVRVRVRVRFS